LWTNILLFLYNIMAYMIYILSKIISKFKNVQKM